MTPESREKGGMPMLSVRLPLRTIAQLDALAAERGINRTRVVRQLLDAGLMGRPAPPSKTPTEAELVALLAERARQGNVSAIKGLLAREAQRDDVDRAIEEFLGADFPR